MNERYFVTEITTTADGTAKAITEKNSVDEARMLFHQILASAYANPAVTYALVYIMNEQGFCQAMETYPREQTEE
jgi:hypothetical protein